LRRGGKLNRRAAGLAMVMFLTSLVTTIMSLVGLQGSGEGKQAADGAEAAAKLAKRSADQGIVVDISAAVSDVALDLFSLNQTNQLPEHTKAIEKIQSRWRGRCARHKVLHTKAIEKIQSRWRGRCARHKVLVDVIIATRRSIIDPTTKSAVKPGFEWLARETGEYDGEQAVETRILREAYTMPQRPCKLPPPGLPPHARRPPPTYPPVGFAGEVSITDVTIAPEELPTSFMPVNAAMSPAAAPSTASTSTSAARILPPRTLKRWDSARVKTLAVQGHKQKLKKKKEVAADEFSDDGFDGDDGGDGGGD